MSISNNSSLKDFKLLETSRSDIPQTKQFNDIVFMYVLLGWTQEGEPLFVDNGLADRMWNLDTMTDNTGKPVKDRLYWRVDHSAGGLGKMLPPFVKINPGNMWLEIDPAIPIKYVKEAL